MGKNTVGRFDYRIIKSDKGAYPFDPIVHITVAQWTVASDNTPLISANLMTDSEIDHWIDALKADLDAVRQRAKVARQKAHRETLEGVV